MLPSKNICFVALSFCFIFQIIAFGKPPRVFILNADTLAAKKQALVTDNTLQEAYQALIALADKQLTVGPFSVMHKNKVPSSGDKHDYMSMGPYWWPDESKPDGLPYIRKDGELNPERLGITDHTQLSKLIKACTVSSLAYYYSDNEKYAEQAAHLLRVWFLNPETRMNPNLNFGQAIPGKTEGRGIGIIETRSFSELVDAIGLIELSAAWTEDDQIALQAWMKEYLHWLLNSQHGRQSEGNGNNHTSWFYTQTIALALFTEQNELAAQLAGRGAAPVIDAQLKEDGSQPHELARTKSWNYSVMNLQAIFYFSLLSAHVGKDYWHYVSQDEASVQKALDFLVPYATGKKEWTYTQISEFEPQKMIELLAIAANQFPEKEYTASAKSIKENYNYVALMY